MKNAVVMLFDEENCHRETRLTEGMLTDWSFYQCNGETEVYRNVLKALRMLIGFQSKLFLYARPSKRWIKFPIFFKGQIELNNIVVLGLDRDPLYWVEKDRQQEAEEWSPEEWKKFLLDMIKKQTIKDLKEKEEKAEEATRAKHEQIKTTKEILEAVNKLS